ncbi:MAG TPA: glycosyltransferase family 39 protein, partial [Chthoniobacteraceae bacterium]
AGVPSGFYFGTPPIPPEGYYTHHPPLLPLLVAGSFRILGESEWAARLVPTLASLFGVVLLWLLVKDCSSARTATFAAALFAATPMEIHYGRMVNFEAVDLVWMLGMLIFLRRWEQTGRRLWRNLLIFAIALALCTAWLGYIFALVLSLHFMTSPDRKYRRFGGLVLVLCVASVVLFFAQIHAVQPAAWESVAKAFRWRTAQTGTPVTWSDWSKRMVDLLLLHIQPVTWLLAVAGTCLTLRRRRENADLRWLGWAALCFFEMNAFYVVAFRNASSIHDYASFYFAVPTALMGAVALEELVQWSERTAPRFALAMGCVILLGLGALSFTGQRTALTLRKPFHILTVEGEEPPTLIPDLGRAIRGWFPEDTAVFCNFLPYYGPQLHYYAQRDILGSVFTPDGLQSVTSDPENDPYGGVVWLGDGRARALLASLPHGTRKEERTIDGVHFCFWLPAPHEQK